MGEADTTGEHGQLVAVATEYAAEVVDLQLAMESTRRQIADSLGDLQDQVETSLDWRAWVAENPWKTVGCAFALGALLGLK